MRPHTQKHEVPAQIYPLVLDLKVETGDTLTTILTDAGISHDEAQRAVTAIRSVV